MPRLLAEVVESTIYVTAKDNVSAAALDNILNDEQIMVKKGRPNVHVMLTRIWQQNPGTKVGTFFCGPAPLGDSLHQGCKGFSSTKRGGCQLDFHKEVF